jgi:predicted membrane protein
MKIEATTTFSLLTIIGFLGYIGIAAFIGYFNVWGVVVAILTSTLIGTIAALIQIISQERK